MNYLKTPVRDWKQNSPNEKAKREAAEAKERELAKRNDFINSMKEFLGAHGGDHNTAEQIIDYAIKKIGRTGFMYHGVTWSASRDCIRYHMHSAACSFFDDGGSEEHFYNWSLTYVSSLPGWEYRLENDKLQDLSTYKEPCKESFYCENPFGLKGVFEIHFDAYKDEKE